MMISDNAIKTIANYLVPMLENGTLPKEVTNSLYEVTTALAIREQKQQDKMAVYNLAKPIIMDILAEVMLPAKELYEACRDQLPDEFSVNMLQYALNNYWNNEIVKTKTDPRAAYIYGMKKEG